MRKITEKTAGAFVMHRSAASGNTWTNGSELYLHGNLIARWENEGETLALSLAGWNTPTTRERLNGVLQIEGLDIRYVQRNYEPRLLSLVTGSEFEVNANEFQRFDVMLQKEAQLLLAELEKEGA